MSKMDKNLDNLKRLHENVVRFCNGWEKKVVDVIERKKNCIVWFLRTRGHLKVVEGHPEEERKTRKRIKVEIQWENKERKYREEDGFEEKIKRMQKY